MPKTALHQTCLIQGPANWSSFMKKQQALLILSCGQAWWGALLSGFEKAPAWCRWKEHRMQPHLSCLKLCKRDIKAALPVGNQSNNRYQVILTPGTVATSTIVFRSSVETEFNIAC
ncbi:Hypothetical predicted protein [Podarcis lilfordi]|uniref:Uncharacterized protein n=1 Tax=Podarcis lilfordi TaxID=74358 RepID=A0AA35KCZ4_9SAUR|nr:Hypothetical predicted protein [Podarcis lilfordi]